MSTSVEIGFVPLFERIMVKPDPVEKSTKSGIVLAVESRKRPNTGVIVAMGHMITNAPKAPMKVGDRVLYQRYSGLDVAWNGVDYHLIMANDLLAVINKDEETTLTFNEPDL
jgi:chaperonin GroES